MKFEKIDIDKCFMINEKLARKYNALVNFVKDNTTYSDGCICASIEELEYVRRQGERLFESDDYIHMKVKVFDTSYCLQINNVKGLHIDRKYNIVEKVDELYLW